MSDLKEMRTADSSATKLVELLREYTDKLKALSSPPRRALNEPKELSDREQRIRRQRFTPQRPGLDDLSRHASQFVEHGDLDTVTRLELRLRLAEFEAELEAAQLMAFS